MPIRNPPGKAASPSFDYDLRCLLALDSTIVTNLVSHTYLSPPHIDEEGVVSECVFVDTDLAELLSVLFLELYRRERRCKNIPYLNDSTSTQQDSSDFEPDVRV